MAKRPIRPRADCPGCGYRHVIEFAPVGVDGRNHFIGNHNAPGGGLCSGSGSTPVGEQDKNGNFFKDGLPAKGPGPNTEGKVAVSGGIEFIPWPKLKRLSNAEFIATEKIDGTNACVQFQPPDLPLAAMQDGDKPFKFAAQSRTRLITPSSDNHGFAAWAYEHQESLFADLGYGVHFGEWYGAGIQRRYGLDHKRFALFNQHRWAEKAGHFLTPNVDVVPVLARGTSLDRVAEQAFDKLRDHGSHLVLGWIKPEGFVIFDVATGGSWKVTDAPSGKGPRDEHQNALGGI